MLMAINTSNTSNTCIPRRGRLKLDPVALYKKFRSLRPLEMLEPDNPLFLSINHNYKNVHGTKKPMGINKLYQIMNDLKAGAGLKKSDKRLTAHRYIRCSIFLSIAFNFSVVALFFGVFVFNTM